VSLALGAAERRTPLHPNERLLMREYEGRARGDVAEVVATLHDGVLWHVPGRSQISGTYRGKAEVMTYISARQELAGGTFQITVEDVLANDEPGLVIASGQAVRNGHAWQWRGHGLYRLRDDKVAECWLLPEDQYLFDEIWS
jgi:ketosteroid isomerase-like protein